MKFSIPRGNSEITTSTVLQVMVCQIVYPACDVILYTYQ